MKLLEYLRKALTKLEVANNGVFTCPTNKQNQYLQHFKEPNDEIERSFYQYKCQMFFYSRLVVLGLNIVSLPVLLYYYLKKDSPLTGMESVDAIFFADGKPDNIVPMTLRKEYGTWLTIENKKEYFSESDKAFFKKIVFRYPFSWQFLLKCLIKLRTYSYEIKAHNPKVIVVCNEYSFTSSMLTKYCESKEITHIDIMHGEKFFDIHDAFFQYDRCYVWDKHYVKLLTKLRAVEKQFIVTVPPSLKFETKNIDRCIDYTYYLGAENGEVLEKILNTMNNLSSKGYKVALRPHPRYTDMRKVKLLNCNFEIENVEQVKIEMSLLRTRNAVSLYSTVLNQAYYNGTGVVLDDMTQPEKFIKLAELDYIMLKLQHKLLSEEIKKYE